MRDKVVCLQNYDPESSRDGNGRICNGTISELQRFRDSSHRIIDYKLLRFMECNFAKAVSSRLKNVKSLPERT